jgi:bacteriocin-like protein
MTKQVGQSTQKNKLSKTEEIKKESNELTEKELDKVTGGTVSLPFTKIEYKNNNQD